MLADTIKTLSDIIDNKAEFIRNPGCDVDFEGIAESLRIEGSDGKLAVLWFDKIVETLSKSDQIILYRHMTVGNVEAFVAGLQDETLHPGDQWSLSDATQSPSPDQSKCPVLLTGTIRVDQIDMFSTFQCLFTHPWEKEIVFSGDIALMALADLDSEIVYEFSSEGYGISI